MVDAQHGVVTHAQLLELGLTRKAIKHRVATGRLYPVRRGVYVVGRRALDRRGEWMAAVLSCGPEAILSHESAAAFWRIRAESRGEIHVSVPVRLSRHQPGVAVHRRSNLSRADLTRRQGIPVTTVVCTLIDLAAQLEAAEVEAAVNQADKLDLVDPETLRSGLSRTPGRPGLGTLKKVLDRRTFALTDSELERRFLRIVRRARLRKPQTGSRVNGFRVDFYWPELGLVVETDGLRYHRTAAQQTRDRLRDQAHVAAGLATLRFTHAQIWFDAEYVESVITSVAGRLAKQQQLIG